MSTSTLPVPFVISKMPMTPEPEGRTPSRPEIAATQIIRRRPNMQQGRSLEILGHAIEYLIDSRMFLVNEPRTLAEADAVLLLSRCSQEVFASCAEIVPVSRRFKSWAMDRLGLLTPAVPPAGRQA